jgi:hypothetical protein
VHDSPSLRKHQRVNERNVHEPFPTNPEATCASRGHSVIRKARSKARSTLVRTSSIRLCLGLLTIISIILHRDIDWPSTSGED